MEEVEDDDTDLWREESEDIQAFWLPPLPLGVGAVGLQQSDESADQGLGSRAGGTLVAGEGGLCEVHFILMKMVMVVW